MHNRFSSPSLRTAPPTRSKKRGFTLIEILVVLAIIAILAAILFPVFNKARASSRRTACQTNLKDIYTAVRLYYDDEKAYPGTLAVLLPADSNLEDTATPPTSVVDKQACTAGAAGSTGTCPNARGTGYLKNTHALVCPDEDRSNTPPVSSYGDTSTRIAPFNKSATDSTGQMARYVWNYFGYKDDGTAYIIAPEGVPASKTEYENNLTAGGDKRFLVDPSKPFDSNQSNAATYNPIDLQKMPRLYNRYTKPSNTIITHCVFHRINLSAALSSPNDLYATPANDVGAQDIILRLDGTAEIVDVTPWQASKTWVKQIP